MVTPTFIALITPPGGAAEARILLLLAPSGRGQHVHLVRAPIGRVELAVVNEEAGGQAPRAGDAHELQQLELLRR